MRRDGGQVPGGPNGASQQGRPGRAKASLLLLHGTPWVRGAALIEDGRWYAVVAAPPRPMVDDVVVCLELVRDRNVLGLGRGGQGRAPGGAAGPPPRPAARPCTPEGGAATRPGRQGRRRDSALVL